ncbi:hypothetical protein Tco_1082401 [Tanacetum coccineum]|uniref:Uncharacterized protein n=1 Tax=Tanacetum coccineum TaxID=301880 RepID=A0ABQ5I081_9ASTR
MGPMVIPRQETTLPHAFTARTLHDPATGAWNMNTGASSHLNASVTNLNDVFNTCIYPSISVGDGHSILVTNTGHSILPTPFRSLHLNNCYVLENPIGPTPVANSPEAAKNAYQRHVSDLLDVGCIMLATIVHEVQDNYMDVGAFDLINQLRLIFQTQARIERFDDIVNLSNCKMAEGSPMSAHVIKMIGHISRLERLSHAIAPKLAIDFILSSLSNEYKNYDKNEGKWKRREVKGKKNDFSRKYSRATNLRKGIPATSAKKIGTGRELVQMVQPKRTRRILLRPQVST